MKCIFFNHRNSINCHQAKPDDKDNHPALHAQTIYFDHDTQLDNKGPTYKLAQANQIENTFQNHVESSRILCHLNRLKGCLRVV